LNIHDIQEGDFLIPLQISGQNYIKTYTDSLLNQIPPMEVLGITFGDSAKCERFKKVLNINFDVNVISQGQFSKLTKYVPIGIITKHDTIVHIMDNRISSYYTFYKLNKNLF
jgi:hypothetical protein